MRLNHLPHAALVAMASTVSATRILGLLQVAPAFSGDGISLFPALNPLHDLDDLQHLIPGFSNELYYSQEGHAPALHGAKHAQLKTTFSSPTVVLEHSNQVQDMVCNGNTIQVCFKTPTALKTAVESWGLDDQAFNLATYHEGCGDETGTRRSFFRATSPVTGSGRGCVTVSVSPIDEKEALAAGELSWGTYVSPDYRKREPVKGHVRVVQPVPAAPSNGTGRMNRTVDLTTDARALKKFFNDTNIDTSQPDHEVDDLEFISPDGELAKRYFGEGLVSWIVNGVKDFIEGVVTFFEKSAQAVIDAANWIAKAAETTARAIQEAFNHKFSKTYHDDFHISKFIKAEASNRPPKIFGIGNGYTLAKTGKVLTIQCAKCGVEGNVTIDGRFAFSLAQGITDGELTLINADPFNIHAQFGITLEGKIPKEVNKIKKQFPALPLTPITIPGIFTLGPQVSVSTALSLEIEGKLQLLVGGTLSLSRGTATLSLVDGSKSKINDGLTASFTPVLKASGSMTVTADLGLPIALEVGIDVLNGNFKKTVGLIDAPSVYASAGISVNEGHKCKGVEVRVGLKNRIYLAAFDLWEYELRDDKFYEKGLFCVTANGFDTDAVEDDESIFKSVNQTLGANNLPDKDKPALNNVAAGLKSGDSKQGFRIVMDAGQTAVLVSGTDGYIYLADTKMGYDLSSPWGTLNMTSNILSFDVFGRLMSYNVQQFWNSRSLITELRVSDPKIMPENQRAASLTALKTQDKDYESYGVSITWEDTFTTLKNAEMLQHFKKYYPHDFAAKYKAYKAEAEAKNKAMFYPTACKISGQGLRLYATQFLFDKNGKPKSPNGDDMTEDYTTFFKKIGLKIKPSDCRTIKLTSQFKNKEN